MLLALMRVSGSRPKFPIIVTLADIIFIGSLTFDFFVYFLNDEYLVKASNLHFCILGFSFCVHHVFLLAAFIFVFAHLDSLMNSWACHFGWLDKITNLFF